MKLGSYFDSSLKPLLNSLGKECNLSHKRAEEELKISFTPIK
jgi:hypothetical protein